MKIQKVTAAATLLVAAGLGGYLGRKSIVSQPGLEFEALGVRVAEYLSEQGSHSSAPFVLVVVASVDDCPVCLKESEQWIRLSRSFDQRVLKTIVLLANALPSEIASFQSLLGDRIQVSADEAGLRRLFLPAVETPAKVLLQGGRPLAVDGANYREVDKEQWYERTSRLISKTSQVGENL